MANRLQIPFLGEYYNDLLVIEAWLKDRSAPTEAQNLLCSELAKREAPRTAIIERLARKRGISADALIDQILAGTAEHLTPEDYSEIRKQQEQQGSEE